MSKAKADQTTVSLSSLKEEIKNLQQALEDYRKATLRSRTAVYRLLVTHGGRLDDDWYRKTAEDCGLGMDEIGHLILDDKLRTLR